MPFVSCYLSSSRPSFMALNEGHIIIIFAAKSFQISPCENSKGENCSICALPTFVNRILNIWYSQPILPTVECRIHFPASKSYGDPNNRFPSHVSLADLPFSLFRPSRTCSRSVWLGAYLFSTLEERKWLQPRKSTRLCTDLSSWPVGIISLLSVCILCKSQLIDSIEDKLVMLHVSLENSIEDKLICQLLCV